MRGIVSILELSLITAKEMCGMIPYAIGLDIGITSVGWATVALDDEDKPVAIPPFVPETTEEKQEYAAAEERRRIRLSR